MCGLSGLYDPSLPESGRSFVEESLDRIEHRGPDGRGAAVLGPTVQGHVRLSLVDLTTASAQPFEHEQGVLTFNGEVWNHRELREQLGGVWRTTGDTEVLAELFAREGFAGLHRAEGMWSFAWTPRATGRTVLVRDRFGKVPLYVRRLPARTGRWEWCSERKGLGPGAVAMPPGSVLDVVSGRLTRWYELPRADAPLTGPDVLGLLSRGVRARLAADAEVCVLLSGGLDSALITALAARERRVVAYTAVYDEESHDLITARRLCEVLGVELREVPVPPVTAESITAAHEAIELGMKAQIEIAVLCLPLARQISRDGFKACLSGEAADELFGGYGNLCIAGSRADDAEWRELRVKQLDKMARGNFVRCNKAFMAHGVECRLPFMERELVERVLSTGKRDCPPGKGLLKDAARRLGLPSWVVNRTKETFQGGSGVAAACARVLHDPARFYRSLHETRFGGAVG